MSSQEDLIPIYGNKNPDPKVVVPDNLFRSKRGVDWANPNGKRQRVFTEAGGAQTIVDPELFGDDFGLDEHGEESEDNPHERELRRTAEVRAHESLTRGVRGAVILQQARQAKQMLTKGQKKLRTLLGKQTYTNDDLAEKLQHDDEGLVFAAAVTPKTNLINSVLGPEEEREDCYGCSRGVGLTRVKASKLDDLRQLILDLHGRTEIMRLCQLVSEWFRTEIMEPCNNGLRKGENRIEPWTSRGVYDHITKHLDAPDFVISGLVRDLREDLEILKSGSVYKVRGETAKNARKIHNQDIFVHPPAHKMMLDTMKALVDLLRSKPENMMFSNPTFSVNKSAPGVVASKSNVEETTRLESIFDEKD